MNKTYSASMTKQGRYSPQKVVSEIQEIARVSEMLMEINSLMTNIASQANFLSVKATEGIHARDENKALMLIVHEAHKLAELSREQSKANWRMLTEIKESIDRINCSIGKPNGFGAIDQGCESIPEPALRTAETEQVSKAAEVVNELSKMDKNISSMLQSVSRYKI